MDSWLNKAMEEVKVEATVKKKKQDIRVCSKERRGKTTLWLTELKQDSRKDSNKATVKQDKNVKDKTNTTTRTMSRLSEQEKGAARDTREVIVMEHDIRSGVKTETSKETAA